MNSFFKEPVDRVPVLEVSGSPLEMGRQFGEACRGAVQELCALRQESSLRHAMKFKGRQRSVADLRAAAAASLAASKNFVAALEEAQGIAEGAGVDLLDLHAMMGYTDLRDALTWGPYDDGCSSLWLPARLCSGGRPLFAQSWDLHEDNMPYVLLLHRRPAKGPATMALTLTGCLSMIGFNDRGLCVGTNNLKSLDAQAQGPHYLILLHSALNSPNISDATQIFMTQPKAGAHFFLACDDRNHCIALEATASTCAQLPSLDEPVLHTNHFLDATLLNFQAQPSAPSSLQRMQILHAALAEGGIWDCARLQCLLADRSCGDLSLCRRDAPDAIATNGAVVIDPVARTLHACRSTPDRGRWITRSFA